MNKFTVGITKPPMVLLQGTAGGALVLFLQEAALKSLLWFIPCIFAIIADAATGRPAARYRQEPVTWSRTIRDSVNKAIAYLSWVIFAVTWSINCDSSAICCTTVAVVLVNEALSVVGNLLEPKGFELSLKALLNLFGKKAGLSGLGSVIKPKTKENG